MAPPVSMSVPGSVGGIVPAWASPKPSQAQPSPPSTPPIIRLRPFMVPSPLPDDDSDDLDGAVTQLHLELPLADRQGVSLHVVVVLVGGVVEGDDVSGAPTGARGRNSGPDRHAPLEPLHEQPG